MIAIGRVGPSPRTCRPKANEAAPEHNIVCVNTQCGVRRPEAHGKEARKRKGRKGDVLTSCARGLLPVLAPVPNGPYCREDESERVGAEAGDLSVAAL